MRVDENRALDGDYGNAFPRVQNRQQQTGSRNRRTTPQFKIATDRIALPR
jgi:hypothetical protein